MYTLQLSLFEKNLLNSMQGTNCILLNHATSFRVAVVLHKVWQLHNLSISLFPFCRPTINPVLLETAAAATTWASVGLAGCLPPEPAACACMGPSSKQCSGRQATERRGHQLIINSCLEMCINACSLADATSNENEL
jgi:hypothetical protein